MQTFHACNTALLHRKCQQYYSKHNMGLKKKLKCLATLNCWPGAPGQLQSRALAGVDGPEYTVFVWMWVCRVMTAKREGAALSE